MSNNISLIQEISLPVIIGEWKDKENWRIEKEKKGMINNSNQRPSTTRNYKLDSFVPF